MNNPVARIMDVNLNRAGEALRGMEEYARFAVDSKALSSRIKHIRHDLKRAAVAWAESHAAADRPLFNRDIRGDVGAGVKTDEEAKRPDARAVAAAACRRAAEALRSLSEYGKIDDAPLAARFEDLRYRVYAVEPLLLADAGLRRRLEEACLFVPVPAEHPGLDPRAATREAVAGGADAVVLRGGTAGDRELYRAASDLAEICREGGAIFLLEGRPHIAGLIDAGGVIGRRDDLPPYLMRRFLGPAKLVGRVAAVPEEADGACADGADFVCVRPEAVGPIAEWDRLPGVVGGGIRRDNVQAVLDAGARTLEVGRAITGARNIAGETAFFKKTVKERRFPGDRQSVKQSSPRTRPSPGDNPHG